MKFLFLSILLFCNLNSDAQQNNPLINSGELIEKGRAFHDNKDYKHAIELYKQIPENDTNYALSLYELSLSYRADSQFLLADQSCHLGLELKSKYRLDFLLNAGSIADEMGNYGKAAQYFETGINNYPNNYSSYTARGINLYYQKKMDSAIIYFQKAILLNPYTPNPHYFLGVINRGKGFLSKAMLSFMHCLLIAPDGSLSKNAVEQLGYISNMNDLTLSNYNTRDHKEETLDNFSEMDEIIASKMAFDNGYKPLSSLNDGIVKQIQVLIEKIGAVPANDGFWSQYYVPLYKQIFSDNQFQVLSYYLFSGLELEVVQNYAKKNKSELHDFVAFLTEQINKMGYGRNQNWALNNNKMQQGYFFSNGKLISYGKYDWEKKIKMGEWSFFYPNGTLKENEKYTSEGKLDGEVLIYSYDSVLTEKAKYKDGDFVGKNYSYYENGNPETEVVLMGQKKNGEQNKYYENGNLRSEEHYVNGLKEGAFKIYYNNGKLRFKGTYKNDKIEGKLIEYYSNGVPSYEYGVVNDEKSGSYISYYLDGSIQKKGAYKDGKMEGEWTSYHINGVVASKENYSNNKRDGVSSYYNVDGKESSIAEYTQGEKNGKIIRKNSAGKTYSVEEFNHGHYKKITYYNPLTDQIINETVIDDKESNTVIVYDEYGNKTADITINRDGIYNGDYKTYYSNGKIAIKANYVNGKLDGVYTKYYMDGNKDEVINYANGEKDGYYQSFFHTGKIYNEGWYKHDLKEGYWYVYNSLSNITAKNYYINDLLVGPQKNYYGSGKIKLIEYDEHDILMKQTCFDTNSHVIIENDFKNGNGNFTEKQFDQNKIKTGTLKNNYMNGLCIIYYPDGRIMKQFFYDMGNLDSTFIEYSSTGKIITEGQYVNNSAHGLWKHYDVNGVLEYTDSFKYGKLEGSQIYYYSNGNIETVVPYKSDEKNGWLTKKSYSGELIYKIKYENGLPISYTYEDASGNLVPDISIKNYAGHIRTFYKNGKLSSEFDFENGHYHGKRKIYYPDGNIYVEQDYSYSLLDGADKCYYPNNKLKYAHNYKFDKLQGAYIYYDENGQIITQKNYTDGICNGSVQHYQSGKLIQTDYYYWGDISEIKKEK
jgi:uncharacterized protein